MIVFEVDGKRVLATGDQHTTGTPEGSPVVLNYQYRNRYRVGDFEQTAALYRRPRPDLLISGHWPAEHVTDAFLDRLEADSRRLRGAAPELLPEDAGLGAEGFGARIEPYRSQLGVGETLALEIAVQNLFDRAERRPCGLSCREAGPSRSRRSSSSPLSVQAAVFDSPSTESRRFAGAYRRGPDGG